MGISTFQGDPVHSGNIPQFCNPCHRCKGPCPSSFQRELPQPQKPCLPSLSYESIVASRLGSAGQTRGQKGGPGRDDRSVPFNRGRGLNPGPCSEAERNRQGWGLDCRQTGRGGVVTKTTSLTELLVSAASQLGPVFQLLCLSASPSFNKNPVKLV